MSVLKVGGWQSMNDENRTDPGGNIYKLTELYEEKQSGPAHAAERKSPGEMVMIDGRSYEQSTPGHTSRARVHDLTDIVDDPAHARFNEALIKNITEIIERIAREIIPDIAGRIIREEIEKLKTHGVRRAQGND